MRTNTQRLSSVVAILAFVMFAVVIFFTGSDFERTALAQESNIKPAVDASPTPSFDQQAAIEKLKVKIKGKENSPAGEVFKNVKEFADFPAARLLAIMEFGFSRSLGVDCTHCHTPEKWASDEKVPKQTAREMWTMQNKINGELLTSIKAFEGRTGRERAIVNCTTCHRGEVKPATNLGR